MNTHGKKRNRLRWCKIDVKLQNVKLLIKNSIFSDSAGTPYFLPCLFYVSMCTTENNFTETIDLFI